MLEEYIKKIAKVEGITLEEAKERVEERASEEVISPAAAAMLILQDLGVFEKPEIKEAERDYEIKTKYKIAAYGVIYNKIKPWVVQKVHEAVTSDKKELEQKFKDICNAMWVPARTAVTSYLVRPDIGFRILKVSTNDKEINKINENFVEKVKFFEDEKQNIVAFVIAYKTIEVIPKTPKE